MCRTIDDVLEELLDRKWLRHTDLCGVHLKTKGYRCTCGLEKYLVDHGVVQMDGRGCLVGSPGTEVTDAKA